MLFRENYPGELYYGGDVLISLARVMLFRGDIVSNRVRAHYGLNLSCESNAFQAIFREKCGPEIVSLNLSCESNAFQVHTPWEGKNPG